MLGIYTRVSTDKQADKGFSLEAQRKLGIEKAKTLKLKYKVFEDAGRSASKDDLSNRPAFNDLLDRIEAGQMTNVFAVDFDRLTRSEATQLTIKKIFKDNKVILYTAQGTVDFNDFDSEFISTIQTAVAHLENRKRIARSKRGMEQAVLKGKWHGGVYPFAYKTDEDNYLIVYEEQAGIYEQMVRWSLDGVGVVKIAGRLNEMGVSTNGSRLYKRKNGITIRNRETGEERFKPKELIKWSAKVVYDILKNPLYKGEMHYKGNVVKVSELIDAKTWGKIQRNFQNNKNTNSRNNKVHFYLLRGFLECARCGSNMSGRINHHRSERHYYCSSKRREVEMENCGLRAINLDKLNELVWYNIVRLFETDAIYDRFEKFVKENATDIGQIKERIEVISRRVSDNEVEQKRLIMLYTKAKISEDEFDKFRSDNQIRHLQFQEKLQELEDQKVLMGDVDMEAIVKEFKKRYGSFVNNANDQLKRDAIEILIERIFIDFEGQNQYDQKGQHSVLMRFKIPLIDGVNTLFYPNINQFLNQLPHILSDPPR